MLQRKYKEVFVTKLIYVSNGDTPPHIGGNMETWRTGHCCDWGMLEYQNIYTKSVVQAHSISIQRQRQQRDLNSVLIVASVPRMSIRLCVVYCLVEGVITDFSPYFPTGGCSGAAAAHATATFSELMAHWAAKEAASGGWHRVVPDNTTGDLSSYSCHPQQPTT